MKRRKPDFSAAELRAALHYDPDTGRFHWAQNRGRKTCVGDEAGGPNHGRWRIKFNDKLWEASNLAWYYMTGVWPVLDVDHEDQDARNNRWGNLREATRSQNCMNQKVRKNSSTGHKGISPHKGGYRVRISAGPGIRYDLGVYREMEHAAAAYRIAAAGIHGKFNGV